jgi:hypothetical protein
MEPAYSGPPYTPPVKEPQRRGRRKINIEYIQDKSRRQITFSKRKAGIMKKAYELATLTGTQVLLLVASESGHVYTFATPKLQPLITEQEGKNLIQNCLNAPSSNNPDQADSNNNENDSPNSTLNIHSYVNKREVDEGDDDDDLDPLPLPKAEPPHSSQKISEFAPAGSYPIAGGPPAFQPNNYLNHIYSRQMPVGPALGIPHLPAHPSSNFTSSSHSLAPPGFPSYSYSSGQPQSVSSGGQYSGGNFLIRPGMILPSGLDNNMNHPSMLSNSGRRQDDEDDDIDDEDDGGEDEDD